MEGREEKEDMYSPMGKKMEPMLKMTSVLASSALGNNVRARLDDNAVRERNGGLNVQSTNAGVLD